MVQAILPPGLSKTDHSISTMRVGESGYTVPWAMYHKKDRSLWLNGNYTISPRPGGTVTMFVSRGENGWDVVANKVPKDSTWEEAEYVGGFVPVRVNTFQGRDQ